MSDAPAKRSTRSDYKTFKQNTYSCDAGMLLVKAFYIVQDTGEAVNEAPIVYSTTDGVQTVLELKFSYL